MARSISRTAAAEHRSHGALPVVIFFVAALAVSMFAIGYIAWQGPHRAGQVFEFGLPKAPQLPRAPNPTPLPAPTPLPR